MQSNSKLLFEKYGKQHFKPGMKVLEIGPDGRPSSYRRIISDPSISWDTVDVQKSPSLTYWASSEYEFPIPSDSYDIVLSGGVIEHVRKVWVWIREVARVCKTGGLVITVAPASWPYHEAPIDCWRLYPEAMKALYDWAALDVQLCECGSLEDVGSNFRLPGRSLEWQSARERLAHRLLRPLGFPVECAFDTIAIGLKFNPQSHSGNTSPPPHP